MSSMICRRAVLHAGGLALLILSAGAPLADSAGREALRAALLPAREIPAGLRLGSHGYVTNAQAARLGHVTVSTFTAMGRSLGYSAQYDSRTGNGRGQGVFYLATRAVRFTSPAAAARGFRYYQQRSRRLYGGTPGFTQFTSPHGRAWAFTYACRCRGASVFDESSLRAGRYYVNVSLGYVPRKSADAQTATLMMDRTVHIMNLVAERLTRAG